MPSCCLGQGCGGRAESGGEGAEIKVEHAERLYCFACLTDLAPDTSAPEEDGNAPEVRAHPPQLVSTCKHCYLKVCTEGLRGSRLPACRLAWLSAVQTASGFFALTVTRTSMRRCTTARAVSPLVKTGLLSLRMQSKWSQAESWRRSVTAFASCACCCANAQRTIVCITDAV